MRKVPSGNFGPRLFWGLMFGVPAAFVFSGLPVIITGWTQGARGAPLCWAGVFVTVAGVIGLLAARSFRRRALSGEPY